MIIRIPKKSGGYNRNPAKKRKIHIVNNPILTEIVRMGKME
jgi:hypothetical protein